MNDKLPEFQNELFGEYKEKKTHGRFFKKNIFSSQSFLINLSYEKAVFITVVLFMVLLVSFTLGVERGKRITSKSESKPKVFEAKKADSALPQDIKDTAQYIIQLKTFTDEINARKEEAYLKSRGFNSFVLKQANIYKVCIGTFEKKEDAQNYLLKLKLRYKDSFVRKR